MPKTRIKTNKNSNYANPVKVAFKLGGRKSTKSAKNFSAKQLQEMLESPSTRKRDKPKIQQALDFATR